MREVTNAVRADYGRETLEHYERARAALGREPNEREDIEMVLDACAHGGSLDRWDPVEVEDLHEDAEWAHEVLRDLASNVFHTADGVTPPRVLLNTVTAPDDQDETARTEAWRRLGEHGPRFACLLAAMRRALLTVHDIDADALLEDAKDVFEEEVEEERYDRQAQLHRQ